MMFIFPIGVALFFFDRATRKMNRELFDNYVSKILNSDLPDPEKINRIDDMYYQNGYTRVAKNATGLTVQKKHFNLGVLLMLLGIAAYFGIIFYLVYYRYFLKPEMITVDTVPVS